ncbi:MAG: PepSY domain-containing protein [Gammaproteobacteria bacterium]|nr:PepSY domain-containing protein [Gammaproteobacteria bacterium]
MLGRLLALSLVLGAALSPLALASRDSGDHDEHERRDRSPHTSREHRRHQRDTLDALSEAVRRGEVLPLWQVKARVIEAFGSRIIDVDIEREDGVWVYEFKVIGEHGRLLEIYVDARSGRVIEIEND